MRDQSLPLRTSEKLILNFWNFVPLQKSTSARETVFSEDHESEKA